MAKRNTEKPAVDDVESAKTEDISGSDTAAPEASDSPTDPESSFATEDLEDATTSDVVVESSMVEAVDADNTSEDPTDASQAKTPDTDGPEATGDGPPEASDDAEVPETSPAAGDPGEPEQEITVTGAETEDQPATPETPAPETPSAPAPVAPAAQQSGPGFLPLLFGGVIAAAIGWGVATFTAPPPPITVDPARVDALEGDIRSVEGSIAELDIPPAVDLSPLETAQADLVSRLDDLTIRIEALEVAAGGAAGAEVLEGLRDELGQIAGALQTSIAETTPRIEALEAKADELGNAEAEARDALRRTAKNQIAAALRDGLPYAEAAATLDDLPEVLAANAEAGLPARAQLAEGFDGLARAALDAAREAGATDGGIGGLASSLLNIRSTEPRDGDDPDAVLSRIEAAVRAGDLETALSEIDALPPEAAAALSDWSAEARTRLDAEAALQDYLEG